MHRMHLAFFALLVATPVALHGGMVLAQQAAKTALTWSPCHDVKAGSYPNVLFANSTHDSSTPIVNALSVLQIPEARLLLSDVDGHQSLIWSRCAYQTVVRFLGDPASGEPTTICAN